MRREVIAFVELVFILITAFILCVVFSPAIGIAAGMMAWALKPEH